MSQLSSQLSVQRQFDGLFSSYETRKKVPNGNGAHKASISQLAGRAHNVDCLELLKSMRTSSVTMVFADPPFNLKKKYSRYKDNIPFGHYMDWTAEWLKEACRVLKPEGSIFVYNIPKLLTHTAPILNEMAEFRHWIAWNANGQPLGKTLQPAHYGILFYTKGPKRKYYDIRAPHKKCRVCGDFHKDYGGKKHLRHPFGPLVSDVWDDIHRVRHRCRRVKTHPCQLPVPLLERMILMTTDEGDIVLDLFAGGGSLAVAAKQMGRRYIGAEIDPDYCTITNEKMEQASNLVDENGIYQSVYLGKTISIRDKDICQHRKK